MNPTDAVDRFIVIAHKDPVIRLGLAAMLAQSRFKDRILTRCPRDELRDSAPSGIAAIVTDYQHGFDLCTQDRREFGRRPSNPAFIMVVSAHDGEHEIRSAIEAGVKGYLLSGFETAEFIAGVEAVGQGKRYLCSAAAHRMVDSMAREALTAREAQVLRCLVDGYVNKQISDELDIALGTVKAHVKSIFQKFGVATRTQVVCMAAQRGILPSAMPWGVLRPDRHDRHASRAI